MDFAMMLIDMTAKRLEAADPLQAMLRFLVGIGVVFLLMWLLYRWMKRSSLGEYEGPGLRLISRLPLTRSSMVAVVEIGGRMFLVGAGDATVTPIAELYDTEEMAAQLDTEAAALTKAKSKSEKREPVKKPFSQVMAMLTRETAPATHEQKPTSKEVVPLRNPVSTPPPGNPPVKPVPPTVTDAQMDALAAQIAAEFGVKQGKTGGRV